MSAKKTRPAMGATGRDSKGRLDLTSDNATESAPNPMQHAASLPAAAVLADVAVWASSVGLVLAGRCQDCGSIISGVESLHAGRGRVCRRRAQKAAREQVAP